MMKYSAKMKLMLIFLLTWFVHGQAADGYIISQKRLITVQPVYQQWVRATNQKLGETSVPIMIYYPVNRNMSVDIRTNQASVAGDRMQSLTGLTDTQIGLTYHLADYNLVFNLGLNVPSGKKELTPTEFSTSLRLSSNYFNFRVPNFGQGLNVAPGVSWAYQMLDHLVLGAGVSYQVKGGFKPLQGMTESYKPGNELLVTGGIDYQLGETAAVSTDFIFVTYSADKLGDNEIFASGRMIITNVQFIKYFDYDELRLFLRYRSKGKNRRAVAGALMEEPSRTSPNQTEAYLIYRKRLGDSFSLGFTAEFRDYEQTSRVSGVEVRGVGLAPAYRVNRNLSVPMALKYLQASYGEGGTTMSGLELGVGLQYVF